MYPRRQNPDDCRALSGTRVASCCGAPSNTSTKCTGCPSRTGHTSAAFAGRIHKARIAAGKATGATLLNHIKFIAVVYVAARAEAQQSRTNLLGTRGRDVLIVYRDARRVLADVDRRVAQVLPGTVERGDHRAGRNVGVALHGRP